MQRHFHQLQIQASEMSLIVCLKQVPRSLVCWRRNSGDTPKFRFQKSADFQILCCRKANTDGPPFWLLFSRSMNGFDFSLSSKIPERTQHHVHCKVKSAPVRRPKISVQLVLTTLVIHSIFYCLVAESPRDAARESIPLYISKRPKA